MQKKERLLIPKNFPLPQQEHHQLKPPSSQQIKALKILPSPTQSFKQKIAFPYANQFETLLVKYSIPYLLSDQLPPSKSKKHSNKWYIDNIRVQIAALKLILFVSQNEALHPFKTLHDIAQALALLAKIQDQSLWESYKVCQKRLKTLKKTIPPAYKNYITFNLNPADSIALQWCRPKNSFN